MSETIDLVHAAQSGDAKALDRLLDRYYPLVQKIVRLRMGHRLRERMESGDILQDAFVKAVERFGKFEMRNPVSLLNWLCKLAENTIREAADRENAQCRTHDREQALPARSTTDSGSAGPVAPATHFLDQMIHKEEAATLLECLDQLPGRQLELILMRDYDGMSFEDIRRRTGRASEGAARVAHAKALRNLERIVTAAAGQAHQRRPEPSFRGSS